MSELFKVNCSPYLGSVEQLSPEIVTLLSTRGDVQVASSPKIVTPILTYDEDGDFTFTKASTIVSKAIPENKYYSGSKEYSPERIADVIYSRTQKNLESYPFLPTYKNGDKTSYHPLALLNYYDLVRLQPSPELATRLMREDFNGQGKLKASSLDKLNQRFFHFFKKELDLYSVPKREIGTFCNIAYTGNFNRLAWHLGFGMANCIPRDRIAREASSLKSAERFLNPVEVPFGDFPKFCGPYITMLRVAFIATETSMLDSGDLMPSAFPRIACKLSKIHKIKDLKAAQEQFGSLNISKQASRAGIELTHDILEEYDETHLHPGAIRFVFPGGLKVNTHCLDTKIQAYTNDQEEVDLLLDIRSITSKGAAVLLAMQDPRFAGKDMNFEELRQVIPQLKKQQVRVGAMKYSAYVGWLPVMRPGQRYTDFSKPTNDIPNDIIAKAIMKQRFDIPEELEKHYAEMVQYVSSLTSEINAIQS